MERIRVLIIDLPPRVSGLTAYYYDEDGQVYCTIIINARLSAERQCTAYDHEIKHIDNGDFDKMIPVEELEIMRHAG